MAKAIARAGRWMADCPACSAPALCKVKQDRVTCIADGCPKKGQEFPIEWPRDIDAIDKLLRDAPERDKYWHPIWPAKEFKKVLADPHHTVGP